MRGVYTYLGGVEGHLHDVLIMIRGSQMKDGEDVLPARLDLAGLGVQL